MLQHAGHGLPTDAAGGLVAVQNLALGNNDRHAGLIQAELLYLRGLGNAATSSTSVETSLISTSGPLPAWA